MPLDPPRRQIAQNHIKSYLAVKRVLYSSHVQTQDEEIQQIQDTSSDSNASSSNEDIASDLSLLSDSDLTDDEDLDMLSSSSSSSSSSSISSSSSMHTSSSSSSSQSSSSAVSMAFHSETLAEFDVQQLEALFNSDLNTYLSLTLETLYSTRYCVPRASVPHGPAYMPFILNDDKINRPDNFRTWLRVTPYTFDTLLSQIEHDPIFSNHSHVPQMPVSHQLAITLHRFGCDGNGVRLPAVAAWAGVGKGTVLLVTRRVMTALLRPHILHSAIHLPTDEEQQAAKAWVQNKSCDAWRDGYLFVDGTLVPFFSRPHFFGENYFDRKSNYSLTFQVSLCLKL